MNMEHERPKVGIGVIVLKDGKVLLGKRKSPLGVGTWSLPGGHLEYGESFEETACREAEEETGLNDLTNIVLVAVCNNIMSESHYVTIGMLAESETGEPKAMEPEKCDEWSWFDPEDLPSPLFEPSRKNLESWRKGAFYS